MNRHGDTDQQTAGRHGKSKAARPAPKARAAAASKGASSKGASSKVVSSKAVSSKAVSSKAHRGNGVEVAPVSARPSRAERANADERMRRIDDVCAAWAAIVAERMAADQQFAELFEAYRNRSSDLRGLFAWDALHAAEAHLSIVNSALARHIGDDGRADPRAILADLRWEQRKLAAVYAVNAFLAVLNQMSQRRAKWANLEEFDPRIAVLSLAHQTLGYAMESLRVAQPGDDLTEKILAASQQDPVWAEKHDSDEVRLAAACAAAAAFFRSIGANELTTGEEILSLYVTRARSRS